MFRWKRHSHTQFEVSHNQLANQIKWYSIFFFFSSFICFEFNIHRFYCDILVVMTDSRFVALTNIFCVCVCFHSSPSWGAIITNGNLFEMFTEYFKWHKAECLMCVQNMEREVHSNRMRKEKGPSLIEEKQQQQK